MKRLLISALLGLVSLAANAQTPRDSAVHIHGNQIQLPTHKYPMFPGDFDVYKGAYDLSNGETMVLQSTGRRIFAQIGARPRTEMVAASYTEFVAVDRQFKMTLEEAFGEVTGEILLVVPGKSAQANSTGGEVVRLLTSR